MTSEPDEWAGHDPPSYIASYSFWLRLVNALRRYLCKGATEADIEDAAAEAQQTTLFDSFSNDILDPDGYAYTIAERKIWKVIKRNRRFQSHDPERSALLSSGAGTAAISDDDFDVVSRIISTFDPDLRTLIELRYLRGLSLKEIAASTGIAVSTVWKKVKSGIARIREMLDGEDT